MLKYSNGFSVAVDSKKKTLLVSLLQHYPDVAVDGSSNNDTKTEVLDTFILDRELAENLAAAILKA